MVRVCGILVIAAASFVLAGCQSPPPRASDAGERRAPARGAVRAFDEALARYATLQTQATTGAQWDAGLREVVDLVQMGVTNEPDSPLCVTTLADLELVGREPDLARAEALYQRSLANARNWPAGYLGLARCARLRGDAQAARDALDRGQAALRYLAEGGGEQEDVRATGMLERTPRERRQLMKDLLARRDLWEADRVVAQGPQEERAMRRVRADIELERLLLRSPEPSADEYDRVLAWDPDYGDVVIRKALACYDAREYRKARDLLVPIVGDARSRLATRADARYVCGASLTAMYLVSGEPREAIDAGVLLDGLVQSHPWHRDARVMGIKLRASAAMKTRDKSVARRALQDLESFEALLRSPIEGFEPSPDDAAFVQQVRSALEQIP